MPPVIFQKQSPRRDEEIDESERSPLRPIVSALVVLGVVVGVLGVLWFSLSSRGPAVVGGAADQARDVVQGVESTLGTNIIDRSDIPWESDDVAHLVGWGSVTLAVGFLLRSRRSLGDIAVGVFAASFGIEVLQKLVTTSRNMSAEDVSANALGIMLALMVLVAAERLLPVKQAAT